MSSKNKKLEILCNEGYRYITYKNVTEDTLLVYDFPGYNQPIFLFQPDLNDTIRIKMDEEVSVHLDTNVKYSMKLSPYEELKTRTYFENYIDINKKGVYRYTLQLHNDGIPLQTCEFEIK